MRPFALITLAASLLSLPAAAAPQTYTLDSNHANVLFAIDHLEGLSQQHGWFRDVSGTLVLDPAQLHVSKLDVVIKADSIDTRHEHRDAALRSDKFFDTATHPTIVFKSTRVSGSDKKLKVEGDLTLRGVTKPVVLDAKLNRVGTDPMSKKPAAGFSATTMIKRSDFGVSAYPSALGEDVAITIDVEFTAK